jgi:hypothetical protein
MKLESGLRELQWWKFVSLRNYTVLATWQIFNRYVIMSCYVTISLFQQVSAKCSLIQRFVCVGTTIEISGREKQCTIHFAINKPEVLTLCIVHTVLQIPFCRGNAFYGSYEILVSIHSSCHLSVCLSISVFSPSVLPPSVIYFIKCRPYSLCGKFYAWDCWGSF